MIEKANDILQRVLVKSMTGSRSAWVETLDEKYS
jgi:hypothetical protein